MSNRILIAVAGYVAVASGTHSFIYNHAMPATHDERLDTYNYNADRVVVSLLGGAFWPIYWVIKVADTIDAALTDAVISKPLVCDDGHGRRWPARDGICYVPAVL